jgi:flagellar hook assembly protein FlgD
VEFYLRGAVSDAPAPAEAIVLDMQGRRVRTLWSGPLARGLTTVQWDGRDQAGRALAPGSYTIRFRSPGAVMDRRIVRLR